MSAGKGPTGFLHPDYAASFSGIGTPIELPSSGGWLIRRPIPGAEFEDAMGCYPLFGCTDWRRLGADLDLLPTGLVSVVLVADPLGEHDSELLEQTFDMVLPFKTHFVIETGPDAQTFVSASHQIQARRALREVEIELCREPLLLLDDCVRLMAVLAERHSIRGPRRLSNEALRRQLEIPGLVMFRAVVNGRTVGFDSWYEQGGCAQGHLAAFDEIGYSVGASYATKWRVIEYFSDRVRWINLGAGTSTSNDDGLARFKRGWANATRQAFLCGRVLMRDAFEQLTRSAGASTSDYFPPYRHDERNPAGHR